MAWKAFTEHFDRMGNQEVYIHSLSNTINKPYKYHPEGIIGWVHEKEQAYSEMEDISEYSMPENLKKTTLLQQLGSHGSEWWRGKIEGMSFLRGQCILNKFTNQKPTTSRRANEVNMQDIQVKNLRNIQ